jgi:hypothetical protein
MFDEPIPADYLRSNIVNDNEQIFCSSKKYISMG